MSDLILSLTVVKPYIAYSRLLDFFTRDEPECCANQQDDYFEIVEMGYFLPETL